MIINSIIAGKQSYKPVTPNVPTGYEKLEWIGTDGNAWIDTGYIATTSTAASVLFNVTEFTGTQAPMGGGWLNNQRFGFCFYTNILDIQLSGTLGTYLQITDTTAYIKMSLSVGNKKLAIKLNDVDFGFYDLSSIYSSYTPETYIGLLCRNHTGGQDRFAIHTRLYESVVTVGGVDVAHFVPARRTLDSEIGMYDVIGNTFKTNAGSGSFTYG